MTVWSWLRFTITLWLLRKAVKTAKTPREVQPATAVPSAKPARFGLAELKAAARARRVDTKVAL